jgi:hypothetical protein
VNVSYPFAADKVPADGFKESLYSREEESNFSVVEMVPNPPVLPIGMPTTLQVAVEVDSETAASRSPEILAPDRPPSVIFKERLTTSAVGKTVTLGWRVVALRNGTTHVDIPFVTKRAQSGSADPLFTFAGRLGCPRFLVSAAGGGDTPLGSDVALATAMTDVTVGVAGKFSGGCRLSVGGRVEAGLAGAYRDSIVYGPIDMTVVSHEPHSQLLGPHLAAMVEGRAFEHRLFGVRVSAGLVWQWFSLNLPKSVEDAASRHRVAIPMEGTVIWHAWPRISLLGTLRISRELVEPTFDLQYTNSPAGVFPSLTPISSGTHWTGGMTVGAEYAIW